MELNIPIPKLKISDSISLCAEAWKAVTSETIRNCWKKTGILPISASPSASPSSPSSPSDEEHNLNEIEEIQRLLNQYNNLVLGELMSAEEFVLIDDGDNYGEEEITDEAIVNMVKPNELNLEEELILPPKISASEALESLNKVLSFLDNPPDNFVIELNNRNILNHLKKQIILFDKNSKVQSVLDDWLNT